MKTLRIAVALLAGLTSAAVASIPLGRGEITLGATAIATYDSNVTASRNGPEDFFGTFIPRLDYVRKAGLIEAEAGLACTFLRYHEQTQYDADNLAASLRFQRRIDPSEKLAGSLSASYREDSGVDPDLNAQVRTKTTAFVGTGSLATGPRTALAIDASHTDTEHSTASDQTMLNAGVTFDYRGFLEDTTLRVNYTYNELQSSGNNILGAGLDQSSHQAIVSLGRPLYRDAFGRVGVGYRVLNRSAAETSTGETRSANTMFTASVEGPFLPPRLFPKIKSRFAISYDNTPAPGANDSGSKTLTGSLGLTWQARDTTAVSFSADRSQRLSANDLTIVSSSVRLGLDQKLRPNLNGMLSAGYSRESFRGIVRTDDRTSLAASLNYRFARSWNASASYQLDLVSSSVRQSDYERHLVSLSVGYLF